MTEAQSSTAGIPRRSSTEPSIAYLVVTYNHRQAIGDCLDAILEQTRRPGAVVVVDNASWDETADYVEEHYPLVTLVRNPRNVGYGAANNLGMEQTGDPLLAVVNPDVRLEPDWAEEMLGALEENPGCAAAEGKLLLAQDPGILNSRGSRLSILGFGCASGLGSEDEPDSQVKSVSYPSGAAFIVRRDAFRHVGGFDESYFLYHEDVDLGLRLHGAGWSVIYVPRARAHHDFRSGLNRKKVHYLEHNRWMTLAKNMPLSYFLRSAPLLLVSELGLLIYLVRTGLLRPKVAAMLALFRDLPPIVVGRLASRAGNVDPARVMTDDFPALLPRDNWAAALARRLQSQYYQAFFAPET